MKLLLTSAGLSNEKIRDKFLELLGKNPKDSTVMFVPTAADPEQDKWFVQSALNELKNLGLQILTVDLKVENEQSLGDKAAVCDVIYVNGGNTFYLLDWVRRSGFNKVLKNFLSQNKVYIGTSAGSILLGPDISVSGWGTSVDRNIVGLNDLTGLKLVPFVISPHFTESERSILESKQKEITYPILALTDKQAIAVQGDTHEFVGENPKVLLNESN